YNCLLAVDTVASLGSVPVKMDEWGIDALYTGSQKCLSAPPGITPISFSKRAEQKIFSRKTPVAVYYLDMKCLGNYWNCYPEPIVYHHTGSATLLYGIREALAIVCEEGIENSIRKHQVCAQRLYEGLDRLGLQPFIRDVNKRLPTITTIKVPDFINWKNASQYAMKRYNFELAGGIGPTLGKVFRIGLMGYNATVENVDYALQVLEDSIKYASSKASKL
ncbi:Spat, partial [Trypoxylus dichotomus]